MRSRTIRKGKVRKIMSTSRRKFTVLLLIEFEFFRASMVQIRMQFNEQLGMSKSWNNREIVFNFVIIKIRLQILTPLLNFRIGKKSEIIVFNVVPLFIEKHNKVFISPRHKNLSLLKRHNIRLIYLFWNDDGKGFENRIKIKVRRDKPCIVFEE